MTTEAALTISESAHTPLKAKINKMAVLAGKLATVTDDIQRFPEGSPERTWNTQLSYLVTRYLDSGRDDALLKALASLTSPARGPEAGWHTLRDFIRTYASWELDDDWRNAVPREYYLCSIPVFLGPKRPMVNVAKLGQLQDILLDSGLVAAGSEAFIVPTGLVSAELLASLSLSQVRQLTKLLVECKRANRWLLAREFLAARDERLDRSMRGTDLYSLLVLFRTEDRTYPFAGAKAGDTEAAEAYAALCEKWSSAAEQHLADAFELPVDDIIVCDPQPYFQGFDELDEELRKRQFLLKTWEVMGGQDEALFEDVSVSVVPFPFSRTAGFDVIFERDGRRLGSVEFLGRLPEPVETTRGLLSDVLATLSLEAVRFDQA